MKKIVIDLDDTITVDPEKARSTIAEWKKNAYIMIYTARCTRHEKEITKKYLDEQNIPYDELIFNKPEADVYIDNLAVEFKDWDEIKEKIKSKLDISRSKNSRKRGRK